jgi:hypothetical protein
MPNCHKIHSPYRLKYTKNFHSKVLQNIPKLGFWYANVLSGNPGSEMRSLFQTKNICFPTAFDDVSGISVKMSFDAWNLLHDLTNLFITHFFEWFCQNRFEPTEDISKISSPDYLIKCPIDETSLISSIHDCV